MRQPELERDPRSSRYLPIGVQTLPSLARLCGLPGGAPMPVRLDPVVDGTMVARRRPATSETERSTVPGVGSA